MTTNELLPLAVMSSSLLPGLIIFALPESRIRWRTALNLLGALAKLALVGLLLVATMVAPGLEFGVPEAGDGARAGMVKTLGLAIAAVSGVVVLREPVGPGQVLGLALLVIGSALVYELLPRQSWVRAPRS